MIDTFIQVVQAWYDRQPSEVRDVMDRMPPYHFYRLPTGRICVIHEYTRHEDGTVSVTVDVDPSHQDQVKVLVPYRLEDVDPADLVRVDEPPDEPPDEEVADDS